MQVLEQQSSQFTTENFSFSARAIIGYFLQPAPAPYATDGEYIRMTDSDVAKRLEELRMFTKQSLNVEQRIEIARQQQAARDAKKMQKDDSSRKDKVIDLRVCSMKGIHMCVFGFTLLVHKLERQTVPRYGKNRPHGGAAKGARITQPASD